MTPSLDLVDACFQNDDPEGAQAALQDFLDRVDALSPAERDAALAALVARVDHPRARIGAMYAITAGALVESGLSPRALAAAIVAPVTRAVAAARRFVPLAEGSPPAENGAEFFGDFIDGATLQRLAAVDPDAVDAYLSLDTWYAPAAAAWTRDPAGLRAAQASPSLTEDLRAIERACGGAQWLATLTRLPLDAPMVFLFPETGEAWSLTADGVVDAGQLSVLAADAMPEAFARIGAPATPAPEVVAVMRGEGPQSLRSGGFSVSFHLYDRRAVDPATGMPEDGRFMWSAPGGTGNHSLAPDFSIGDLSSLRGARVVVAVGPNAPGRFRYVRALGATRAFDGLRAKLSDVRRLPDDEARDWFKAVNAANAS